MWVEPELPVHPLCAPDHRARALALQASLRATLNRLVPTVLGADPRLVASVNTARRPRRRGAGARVTPDVAVVGGGIVGCALAAFLAEGGAQVVLYEREAIAAGASGRNSGVVQDTFDPALTDLYEESLEHYRTLGHGFELPAEPAGLLLVSDQPLEPLPGLRTYLEGAALRAAEPALADGLVAHRLDTGRPVPPAAAAHAFAARAREAGARLEIGAAQLRDAARSSTASRAPPAPWRSPPDRGAPT